MPINTKQRPFQLLYVWTVVMEDVATESRACALERVPVLQTRYVLLLLMKAVQACMSKTEVLTCVELEGLPLGPDYLSELIKVSDAVSHSCPKCVSIGGLPSLSRQMLGIILYDDLWPLPSQLIIWCCVTCALEKASLSKPNNNIEGVRELLHHKLPLSAWFVVLVLSAGMTWQVDKCVCLLKCNTVNKHGALEVSYTLWLAPWWNSFGFVSF
jgi:hypothetical protein